MDSKWYNITASKDGGNTVASVDIFGVIGWEVNADEFIARHRAMGAHRTLVNINSPGGSVVDGFAIYSYLLGLQNVTTQVVGLAGSAASIILQAGKYRKMPKNSFVLIHDASGSILGGGAEDFEATAKELRAINNMLEAIYVSRGGADPKSIREAMKEDRLLVPEEAKALGLIDEVTEAVSFSALYDREKVLARWGEKALWHLENVAQTGNNMGLFKKKDERGDFLAKAILALDESIDIDALVKGGDVEALAKAFKEGMAEAIAEATDGIKAETRKAVFAEVGGALGGTFADAAAIKAHVDQAIAAEVPKELAKLGYKPSPTQKAQQDQPTGFKKSALTLAAEMIRAQEGSVK